MKLRLTSWSLRYRGFWLNKSGPIKVLPQADVAVKHKSKKIIAIGVIAAVVAAVLLYIFGMDFWIMGGVLKKI